MILATWNIRGLNQAHKHKELQLFLKKNKVDVLGCLETKSRHIELRKFNEGWHRAGMLTVITLVHQMEGFGYCGRVIFRFRSLQIQTSLYIVRLRNKVLTFQHLLVWCIHRMIFSRGKIYGESFND